jgi:hypothetical protein
MYCYNYKMLSVKKLDDNFKTLLDKALTYYTSDDTNIRFFGRVPLSRYHTLKYCFEEFEKNNMKTVVELGTSRSFVDGRYEGCNSDNSKFWEPEKSEKWDWAAGCFTKTTSTCLEHIDGFHLTTVDLIQNHINRCKIMNSNANNIDYYVMPSEEFLSATTNKIDLLYLDTGDMTPILPTAQLHLREAQIIVERDLVNENGIILIDDIRSAVPYEHGENIDLGKGFLSIPYFLENGFELIMDEYQTVLRKK